MAPKQRPRAPERWAYAYQLNPPQPEPLFAKVKMLLRRARLAARRDGRLWTGQMVKDAHITHILVVTDAPEDGLCDQGARAGVVAARDAPQTLSENTRSLRLRGSVGRRRSCANAR